MRIRVMTYNIQHGHVNLTNYIDLKMVCEVIREYAPDIVGLNEVRGRGSREDYTAQAEFMADYLGYHCYFGRSIYVDGDNPYGNAVISKYPIISSSVIRIPAPDCCDKISCFEPRSICRCMVEIPEKICRIRDGISDKTGKSSAKVSPGGKKIAVYSSHFGLSQAEQENAVTTACNIVSDDEKTAKIPAVLMGDFNITPENQLLDKLRAVMAGTDEVLAGQNSFPSHKPECRIDYIFVSRGIKVVDAGIPQIIASDHCPVYADIEI